MGNAFLWYYPDSGGGLEAIDIGEGFSDLQPELFNTGTATRSAGGRIFSTSWGNYWSVRVVVELIEASSRAALVRDLRSLEAHLKSGGGVGLAHDTSSAWAAFATGPVRRGATQLVTTGCPFYNQSASLSVGDQVWVESALPTAFREMDTVAAVVGNKITLSNGARYEHADTPVLVRHELFFPYMRLARAARARPILTHDKGLTWTLDLLLEEDTAALWSFARASGAPVRGETGVKGEELEEIIAPTASGMSVNPSVTRWFT